MTTKPKTNSDANGNAPKRKSRAKQEPKTSPTDAVSVDPVSIGSQDTETTETDAGNNDGKPSSTPPTANQPNEQDKGNDTLCSAAAGSLAAEASADPPREESQAAATRRWRATGIADQVAVYRDRMREEYRAAHPKAKRREAHEYAWACALAAFPPPGVEPQSLEEEPEILEIPAPEQELAIEPEPEPSTIVDTSVAADQGVTGLGDLPADWGELPANASLQVEIAWVTANRLRVRDGSGVDLSRALSPAPSYSALSWLETSILFPSKFADISVKATANQGDEKELIRREKASIEEIRSILKEMLED